MKDSLDKDLEVMVEKMEASKALETCKVLEGGKLGSVSLLEKFVTLNNFLGLLMVWFEKEINSLLRKIESREVCEVEVVGGKKKLLSATHLEREIQKLKCLVNYNCFPLSARGRERGNGV